MKPLDPFDIAAKTMQLPAMVNLSTTHEPDLFFDGDRFMAYLNRTYHYFDIMTYSVSKARAFPLGKIRRLIYGLRQHGTNPNAEKKKLVPNNHIKMFICYTDVVAVPTVYLGSQNLTYGTNLNIMSKARLGHVEPLIVFFELVWNS